MFSNIIDKMRDNQVIFASGLAKEDFAKIENIYCLKFPNKLKEFLTLAMPIASKGQLSAREKQTVVHNFPVWNDYSEINIQRIKGLIGIPKQRILEEYYLDVVLLEKLVHQNAVQINSEEEYKKFFSQAERVSHLNQLKKIVSELEPLIPIFSHRYMVIHNDIDNPVISAVGTDIIVYGNSLEDYLLNEFIKKPTDINFDESAHEKIGNWNLFL